jgi:hypothetical protein
MEEEHLDLDVEQERAKSWRRPPPPPHDPAAQALIFQQIEIDFYIGVLETTRSWILLRAILNFTPGLQRGVICTLGGMFTPSFTPRGEHSSV